MFISMNTKEPSEQENGMSYINKVFEAGRVIKQRFGDGHPKFLSDKKYKDQVFLSL